MWFLLLCIPDHWSVPLYYMMYCWPLWIFFFSFFFLNFIYCILQLIWLLFISSVFVDILTGFIHSSLSLLSILIITLNSWWDILLISTSFHSFSEVYHFLSFRTYSCTSFSQFCVYFYVFSRLVTFPSLGEVALCRCSVGPNSTLRSGHQSYIPRCPVGLRAPFFCGRANYLGLVGRAGSWSCWL